MTPFFVIYLSLYVPWAPEGYQHMLHRTDFRYDSAAECYEDGPRDVAAWKEMRESAGQGAIVVKHLICYRVGNPSETVS